MANPNLQLPTDAAKLLRPILGELVFVGGCTTALLITDKAAADVRPTLMWMRLRKSPPMPSTLNSQSDGESLGFNKTPEKALHFVVGVTNDDA